MSKPEVWKECKEHKAFVWCPIGCYYECTECGIAFNEREYKLLLDNALLRKALKEAWTGYGRVVGIIKTCRDNKKRVAEWMARAVDDEYFVFRDKYIKILEGP